MRNRGILGALIAAVLAGPPATDAAAERRQRRTPEASPMLRAANAADLGNLELAQSSPGRVASRRQAVTDLVIRLGPSGDTPLAVAMRLDNATRTGRGRTLFAAELIVVAGGRVLIEERAQCGIWAGDVSLCRTECDGGAFALARDSGGEGITLRLIVGRMPGFDGEGFADGVRIAACRDGGAATSLVARAGVRLAEIELQPE